MLDCAAMRAYNLRLVPDPLWLTIQRKAKSDGYTIRTIIIMLLRRYAKGEIEL